VGTTLLGGVGDASGGHRRRVHPQGREDRRPGEELGGVRKTGDTVAKLFPDPATK
jgi:hypothetical protein